MVSKVKSRGSGMVTAIKCNDYLNHADVGDLMVHTPVYPCSIPLCTMVHTPVYYCPHPYVLLSTPLCTMVHTPVYYGPHTCAIVQTP